MKFILNYCLILVISLAIFPIFLITSIIIFFSCGLPIIHWSKRVGKDEKIFYMAKFRTMKKNTPQVATHLIHNPNEYITKIGKILRKTSLDEIPQFINLLKLDMVIVGPRPALFNQYDLIKIRSDKGINKLKPGITGLAQVNGRDEMSIDEKVNFDLIYMNKKSFFFDIKIIINTSIKIIYAKNITH